MINFAHSIDEALFFLRDNASFIFSGNATVLFRSNYGREVYDIIKEHDDLTFRAMECPTEEIERVLRILLSSSTDFLDNVGSWRSLTEKELDYVRFELARHIPEKKNEPERAIEAPEEVMEEPSDAKEGAEEGPQGRIASNSDSATKADESLYILINSSIPDLVKIGRTERSAEYRAAELSGNTGIPTPFVVFRAFNVTNSAEAEKLVHKRLAEYRVSLNREFFKIEPELACEIVESLLQPTPSPIENDLDEMTLFQAECLCLQQSGIWPGLLMSKPGITYTQAEIVMKHLIDSRIVNERGLPIRVLNKPQPGS